MPTWHTARVVRRWRDASVSPPLLSSHPLSSHHLSPLISSPPISSPPISSHPLSSHHLSPLISSLLRPISQVRVAGRIRGGGAAAGGGRGVQSSDARTPPPPRMATVRGLSHQPHMTAPTRPVSPACGSSSHSATRHAGLSNRHQPHMTAPTRPVSFMLLCLTPSHLRNPCCPVSSHLISGA
jgi:hypothetical protein